MRADQIAARWAAMLAAPQHRRTWGRRRLPLALFKNLRQWRITARGAPWLLWTIALSLCAHSQDLRYMRHQSWSTEGGLPQDSVHQILQTTDGYLWVATEAGVARFDGINFRVFDHRNETAFASDDTCCLAEDDHRNLVIGTSNGLVVKQGRSFRLFTEKDGLPSAFVQALTHQADGSVLVHTLAGAVVWVNNRLGKLPGSVAPLTAGSGSAEMRPAGDGWSYSDTIVAVKQGTVLQQWIVGANLPGSKVETLLVDRHKTAWVGTNRGLVLLTKGSAAAVRVPWLQGNVVLQVYQDREGNYWIGTETSGLHVLRTLKFRGEHELTDQAVSSVVQSGPDRIWVGTPRDGLKLLRNDGGVTAIPAEKLTSAFILSLAPGNDDSVWAGTPDGVNHVQTDGSVQRITSADGLPDDYARALASDAHGGVWIGTRRGLAHFSGGHVSTLTKANGLGSDLVGVLLGTHDGNLWAGTSGGLSCREPNGRITTVAVHKGSANKIVTALAEDIAGSVWLGTNTGEVGRISHGVLEMSHALQPLQVLGLAGDAQGYLWLRNERGIDRVSIASLEQCFATTGRCAPEMRHYGLADGMPSLEVMLDSVPVLWKTSGDEFWFATRRGLAITAPDHLPFNPVPPPMVIERFLADEVPLNTAADNIEVPSGHLRFTIDYAGLSFTAPSEVRYRYKLDGFDSDWIDAGTRRSATYTNLRPRQYRFRVQAMNNDGVWNQAGATLPFRVVPPFYRRWWFLGLAALVLAALIWGAYHLRLRSLQARFDAVLGERNRMAREIHDTLAQDFVGISLQLDIVHQLLGSRKVDAAMKQVQQTRKLVTEGLAEARQSIWELRANLAQDSLPTRLSGLVERYSTPQLAIQLRIGGAYRALDSKLEAEVLRIAQEALSNVQRHSGAAHASVDLHYRSDMLVLTVEDCGTGFVLDEATNKDGHYGLAGMRERAQSMGSTLVIETGPMRGTRITLTSAIAGTEK